MLSKLNLKRKCIAILCSVATAAAVLPVSYTHLDVYKRQV